MPYLREGCHAWQLSHRCGRNALQILQKRRGIPGKQTLPIP
jgi:hypothetical protein